MFFVQVVNHLVAIAKRDNGLLPFILLTPYLELPLVYTIPLPLSTSLVVSLRHAERTADHPRPIPRVSGLGFFC